MFSSIKLGHTLKRLHQKVNCRLWTHKYESPQPFGIVIRSKGIQYERCTCQTAASDCGCFLADFSFSHRTSNSSLALGRLRLQLFKAPAEIAFKAHPLSGFGDKYVLGWAHVSASPARNHADRGRRKWSSNHSGS